MKNSKISKEKCSFSYDHYRQMLKKALKQGFIFSNFQNYKKEKIGKKIIILRHDVDYSPKRALELAKIEKDLNIKSTFFIRVHGEYYHPFDRVTFPIITKIKRLGHEIGLHYEARTLSRIFNDSFKNLFLKEKKILEDILQIKIVSASEHADLDRKDGYWRENIFTKIKKSEVGIKNHTYEKQFQSFYLADSQSKWNEGCLCKNLDRRDIQLLVHPDWWGPDAKKEINELIKGKNSF